MTKEEEKKAAEELRLAILKKEFFEKKLLDAGYLIDYSPDKTIVNIRKPVTIEL